MPLECASIDGPLLVQTGGKGEFWRMHVELKSAVLTLTHVARGGGVVATAVIPPGSSVVVRNPKSVRPNQSPHCFRVDLPAPDSTGIKKYIFDPESHGNRMCWEQALSGRVSDVSVDDIDTMAGARYQVVTRTHVYKDLEETSARIGRLKPGEVINAKERVVCSSGLPRVRFERGWVTEIEQNGIEVLRLLEQERWQTQHLRPTESARTCSGCYAAFSMFTRAHNCRRCGEVFCSACAATAMLLPQLGYKTPQRVCGDCRESVQLSLVEAIDSAAEQTLSPQSNGSGWFDRPGFLDRMDEKVRAHQLKPVLLLVTVVQLLTGMFACTGRCGSHSPRY